MGKLSDKLNIAVSKNYEFPAAAASTFADATHGLGTDKLHIVLERRISTGPDEWEPLDPGNYVTVTSTQILDSGLSTLGADVIRLKASTEVGLFSSFASSTQQGIVSTVAQSFAGDKTFDGSVGIGKTPARILDIEFNLDGEDGLKLKNTNTGTANGNQTNITLENSASETLQIAMFGANAGSTLFGLNRNDLGSVLTTATPLAIGTLSADALVLGTSNAERMRIDGTGNVGIGTTSPSYTLQTNGFFGAVRQVLNSANEPDNALAVTSSVVSIIGGTLNTINGIDASSAGEGAYLFLHNDTGGTVTLNGGSLSAIAEDRLGLGNGVSQILLQSTDTATFVYVASRWRLVAFT